MTRVSSCFATLLIVMLLGTPAVLRAQDAPAVSFEHLTVSSAAVSLASATVNPTGPDLARYCRGIVETAAIRIRVDGGTPTATSGNLAEVGTVVQLRGGAVASFQAIRQSSTDGALPLTCYGASPTSGPGLEVSPSPVGSATTGTGNAVHATSPTVTDATLSTGTLSGLFNGTLTLEGRLFLRDSFDQGYFIHQDDMTVKSVTDAQVNIVHGSPLGLVSYREELTKTASSWLVADGTLDIGADDTTDDEGVEIVFGGQGTITTEGVIVAGTSGACVSASITLTDISGTDQIQLGWRQNETFTDVAAYAGYTIWNTVGVNAVDGSIVSSQEVSEATDTDDSGVNMADGETRAFKVCIDADGVPTAFYSDALTDGETAEVAYNAITMTNTGSTLTAGTQLYPFLSFLAAGTDGPNPLVLWVQLEPAS